MGREAISRTRLVEKPTVFPDINDFLAQAVELPQISGRQ
jgi:hypothetical protein